MNIAPIRNAFCGFVVFLTSCANPLDVLGPRDKPKIASDPWDRMQVSYWIFTKKQDEEIQRTFTISDPVVVDRLKSKLRLRKVSGLSIGSGDQLVFTGRDGDIWHGDIVFEDTLYMARSDNAWRSYAFTLKDAEFYEELRSICALNEKKYHPQATSAHIKLRSNLSFNYPRL